MNDADKKQIAELKKAVQTVTRRLYGDYIKTAMMTGKCPEPESFHENWIRMNVRCDDTFKECVFKMFLNTLVGDKK